MRLTRRGGTLRSGGRRPPSTRTRHGARPPRSARLGLVLLVAACGALAGCGAEVRILTDCRAHEGVTPICGFRNPEDLVQLPRSSWLLVSQTAPAEGGTGSLEAMRVHDQRRRRLHPPPSPRAASGGAPAAPRQRAAAGPSPGWGASDCPGAPDPQRFDPRGVDVAERSDGAVAVAVVNHGGRGAVELFELGRDRGGPTLAWRGCVPVPEGVFATDVAMLRDGGLIATHALPLDGSVDTWVGAVGLALGWESGALLEWRPGRGWTELAGSAGIAPGGVAVSLDEREVYFSEWGGERLVRLARGAPDGSAPAAERLAIDLPHHPVNLSWTRDGHLLVAGQLGDLRDVIGCAAIERGTCAMGYSVVRVDPLGLTTEVLLEDEGAASVALQVGDEVYIGTFAGDRIARTHYVR